MSYTGYIVWFILMAVMITAILAVGTLMMAGLLPAPGNHHEDDAATREARAEEKALEHAAHHHWWQRAA